MENNYDAIVVGAGPGGVTVASLLSNSGKKVLLADKNPKCGGRMMTVVRDGFHYELFPINCVPQHNSLQGLVQRRMDLVPEKIALRSYRSRRFAH